MRIKQGPNASHVSGTIKSMDRSAQTVTLETGKIYHSQAAMDLTRFKSGDKVEVTYTEADGKMNATDLNIAV